MKRVGIVTAVRSLGRILRGRPHPPPSLANNVLLQVILKRRSVRRFTARPIPGDVFSAILEAGRLAPSTVNLQTWSFAVFDTDTWRQVFERGIPFRGSRAVIIIADSHRDRQVLDVFPYSPLVEFTIGVINASLAAMNMNIAAEALGVSSVMLSETGQTGLLDAGYLKEKLGLPEGTVPLMTIVFGYAAGVRPVMPPKLALEQITFQGKYSPPATPEMQEWLNQMVVGYKASHPGSSFEKQLAIYQGKIERAEQDLERMVYYRKGSNAAEASEPSRIADPPAGESRG